jgi:RNA polymerase sigma factor (sigma-70 family)
VVATSAGDGPCVAVRCILASRTVRTAHWCEFRRGASARGATRREQGSFAVRTVEGEGPVHALRWKFLKVLHNAFGYLSVFRSTRGSDMANVGHILAQITRDAGPRLAAYGYVLTGTQTDAEELVQEAIVKTLIRRPRLSEVAAAEQYVRLTMKTLSIDKARKEARFRKNAPVQAHPAALPDSVQAISNKVAVSAALTNLTAQQRVAIALRYWDDLTVPEVAHAMKVRPGTVKRYLHDAAAALRPLLGDHDERDDDEAIRVVGFEGGRNAR